MSSFLLLLACTAPNGSSTDDSAIAEDSSPGDSSSEETGGEETGGEETGGEDTDDSEEPAPDYSSSGPWSVSTRTDSRQTATGCSLTSTVFSPPQPKGTVVVLHGFMRSGATMSGWGEHLASWGFEVWVPDLCWSGLSAYPDRNAADVLELIDGGSASLVGFSAGGLSVLLAGKDPSVDAIVGLDPVEQFGQDNGGEAAKVKVPALAVFGEGSSCNSQGSGRSLYQGIQGVELLDLEGASHCDFENPTDGLCEAVCPYPTGASTTPEQRREALTAVVTGWLLTGQVLADDYAGVLVP